jgi:hypothetical protein
METRGDERRSAETFRIKDRTRNCRSLIVDHVKVERNGNRGTEEREERKQKMEMRRREMR